MYTLFCYIDKGGELKEADSADDDAVRQRIVNMLIVDDSATCRNMVRKAFLDIDGYLVCCDQASDGEQAIDMVTYNLEMCGHRLVRDDGDSAAVSTAEPKLPPHLKSTCHGVYDVILMDYQMPNVDGPTAIKAIRKLGYPGKIVGLTGNAMSSEFNVMYDAGANEVLPKPVNQETLEKIVTG